MGARIRLWCPDMVVTVSLFLFPILSSIRRLTRMTEEKTAREPGLTGPCCKTLQRMEAQDAAFESRLRALGG